MDLSHVWKGKKKAKSTLAWGCWHEPKMMCLCPLWHHKVWTLNRNPNYKVIVCLIVCTVDIGNDEISYQIFIYIPGTSKDASWPPNCTVSPLFTAWSFGFLLKDGSFTCVKGDKTRRNLHLPGAVGTNLVGSACALCDITKRWNRELLVLAH